MLEQLQKMFVMGMINKLINVIRMLCYSILIKIKHRNKIREKILLEIKVDRSKMRIFYIVFLILTKTIQIYSLAWLFLLKVLKRKNVRIVDGLAILIWWLFFALQHFISCYNNCITYIISNIQIISLFNSLFVICCFIWNQMLFLVLQTFHYIAPFTYNQHFLHLWVFFM